MKNEDTTCKCYIHQITWKFQLYKFNKIRLSINKINLICMNINRYAKNYKINTTGAFFLEVLLRLLNN